MTDTAIPYFEDEESKLRPELPIIERDAINAIILDPSTGKVLCLDWKKFGWKTFVIGGIEKGEDPIKAAVREIKEETGYKNLQFIAEVGKTRSGYYAAHKKENRISNATGLLFELIDGERDETNESETANHVFKWIAKGDVTAFLTLSSQKYIWKNALKMVNRQKISKE